MITAGKLTVFDSFSRKKLRRKAKYFHECASYSM